MSERKKKNQKKQNNFLSLLHDNARQGEIIKIIQTFCVTDCLPDRRRFSYFMKFNNKKLSKLVADTRKSYCLSLRELENHVDIDHSTLGRMERGEYPDGRPYVPDIISLFKISNWLGVLMESFFTNK